MWYPQDVNKQKATQNETAAGAPEAPRKLKKDTDKSLVQILPFPGKARRVSPQLSESLNQTQWHELGIALGRLDEAKTVVQLIFQSLGDCVLDIRRAAHELDACRDVIEELKAFITEGKWNATARSKVKTLEATRLTEL